MAPRVWEGNRDRPSFWIGFLVLTGVLAACTADGQHEPRASRPIVADVILTIDNRTARGVVIYIEAGNTRDSLGVVPRRSSRSFPLPSAVGDSTSALRLEARAGRAAADLRSDVFHVSSGHQVVWTIDRNRHGTVVMR
jgi:hypothetical protein